MPADSTSPGLAVHWDRRRAIVNLRGDPADVGFTHAVSAVLGLALPIEPNVCAKDDRHRIVWAGPDDWFVLGPPDTQAALAASLRTAAAGTHHAVTDVSSGYAVLRLSGPSARDVLCQGCPLDLDPQAFGVTESAGTHFFKASIWIWRAAQGTGSTNDAWELLVRSSFSGYVDVLLQRCTLECGMALV
jgi:sarcosine oxidase, subunit gamma